MEDGLFMACPDEAMCKVGLLCTLLLYATMAGVSHASKLSHKVLDFGLTLKEVCHARDSQNWLISLKSSALACQSVPSGMLWLAGQTCFTLHACCFTTTQVD